MRARSQREKKRKRGTELERKRVRERTEISPMDSSHKKEIQTKPQGAVPRQSGREEGKGTVSLEGGLSCSQRWRGKPSPKNSIRLLFFYWLFPQLIHWVMARKVCKGQVKGLQKGAADEIEQEVSQAIFLPLCSKMHKGLALISAENSQPLCPQLSNKLQPFQKAISPP